MQKPRSTPTNAFRFKPPGARLAANPSRRIGSFRRHRPTITALALALLLVLLVPDVPAAEAVHFGVEQGAERVRDGVVAYYPFTESEGVVAADRGNSGSPVNLSLGDGTGWIDDRNGVRLSGDGVLLGQNATKINKAIRSSGEFSLEFWSKRTATGTRASLVSSLVSLTTDGTDRNLRLGIWLDRIAVGFVRTTKTPPSGNLAAIASVDKEPNVHHYVLRFVDGTAMLFQDGHAISTRQIAGTTANWELNHSLFVGNDVNGKSPWRGDLYLLAIYDRALSDDEIRLNFEAGSEVEGPPPGGPVDPPAENQPPQVNAGPDLTLLGGNMGVQLAGAVEDDGMPGGPLVVKWTQVKGPGNALFDDPTRLDANVEFDAYGLYVLELSATDGELTSKDAIIVVVDPPAENQPPQVNAGPDLTLGGGNMGVLLAGAAKDDGMPGGPLVVTWTQVNGPGNALFDDPTRLNAYVKFDSYGQYVLALSAADGELTSKDTITVVVNPPAENQPPQVDAGTDLTLRGGNMGVQLAGAVEDDGMPGGPLVVKWAQITGPGNALFDDPTRVNAYVEFDDYGQYVLELSANDGELTSKDTITVVVEDDAISGNLPRLLEQSTWGGTPQDLSRLAAIGPEQFLQEQFNAPRSTVKAYMWGWPTPFQQEFFVNAIHGKDQLRQRMAFALHQILVATGKKVQRSNQVAPYWDILTKHAFGNYRDLLEDIALSPTMGDFLDNVKNRGDLTGTPPNENFARESMQLMTLGTCILSIQGDCQTNAQGEPVATYSEDVVVDLARALSGWTYPTRPGDSPQWKNRKHYVGPMIPFDEYHDQGEKVLMNGFRIPAGQSAREDMEMALDHLFGHPNVGPFVSKTLIQRLVTSNPSKAYVAAVARTFNDNGRGERGDLKAVARAILLHPEAQQPKPSIGGHLRAPVIYALAALRNLGASATMLNRIKEQARNMGQEPFMPPSVFSYFSPSYRIPGSGGVLGPEFQIHTISNAIDRANFAFRVVNDHVGGGVFVDISRFTALVGDPELLADEIDSTLFQGRMPNEVRAAILKLVAAGGSQTKVAKNALYVALTSAAYQVQQ